MEVKKLEDGRLYRVNDNYFVIALRPDLSGSEIAESEAIPLPEGDYLR
ncbi:hypothetical protein [Sphingobacterium paucimobilis]|nr:hypothetical protein [Sphingobacterium paucimobilis]